MTRRSSERTTERSAEASRRHRVAWIVAAVTTVVLVCGVVGWRMHEQHAVRVGDRFDGVTVYSGQTTPAAQETVPLAFGSLVVTVGTGDEVGERGHRLKAPGGATMVHVSWASSSSYLSPAVWPTADAGDRRDPGAELILVTDGRRYSIAPSVKSADENGSAVVVVKGHGAGAHVETRIAGRTFGATFGNPTPRVEQSDGFRGCEDNTSETYSRVSCVLPVRRAGYVAGLGVAPAGKEWLVVSGATATRDQRPISRYRDGSGLARYLPSGPPRISVMVDGVTAKPRMAGRDAVIGDSVRVADRAWLVDAERPSTVRLHYRLTSKLERSTSTWTDAPATHEVDVSTKTSYPAA